MPIYKQWQNGDTARAAIWRIDETEDFFKEQTGLFSDKKSEIRRLEHLAARFLLQEIAPAFPLDKIAKSPLGKPYLTDHSLFFSISHSFPYVAVAIDTTKETGIDIQTIQPKILRLQSKFPSPDEQALCANQAGRITLAWAAKEAAFKWYGKGAVDFIRHMPITAMDIHAGKGELSMLFSREQPLDIKLFGSIEPDFAWSVTR